MSSILKRILKGQARPAVMRPVPMVPMAQHPARTQTVETLELRVRQALPPRPAFGDPDVGADATPRSLLMSADRVRHMGDCRVAQLERELVMERLRVKELREQVESMRAELETLRAMRQAGGLARSEPEAAGVPWWESEGVFADEESEDRFHRVRRGAIQHGLIVIEGPPGSGKTLMGTMLAGKDSARPWPAERVLERMVARVRRGVLFFDDIDTRYPYYRGEVPQPGGENLHSAAIIEALGKEGPLAVVLAGQHIALSPEMQRLAICIRLKGGAL